MIHDIKIRVKVFLLFFFKFLLGVFKLLKFSNRLKQLRKEKNLKQSDMAELLELTTRHYQLEYGKVNIPTLTLIFLADYFDVSLDYLVGRTDNPNSHKS